MPVRAGVGALVAILVAPARTEARAQPWWQADPLDAAGAALGYSVAGGGDFDGDGRPDVAVGAPEVGRCGNAYVYLGGNGPGRAPDWTQVEECNKDETADFGRRIAWIGDMLAKGTDALAYSAPERCLCSPDSCPPVSCRRGSVWARQLDWFNGRWLNRPAGGLNPGGRGPIGEWLSPSGDFCGEECHGFATLDYSGRRNDPAALRLYLHCGDDRSEWLCHFCSKTPFSGPLASVGDVDGDGRDDLVVGDRVVPGQPCTDNDCDDVDDAVWEPDYWFLVTPGRLVAAAGGDLTGDGHGDVVLSTAGAVLVFGGRTDGVGPEPTWTLPAPDGDDSFGASLASNADENADGVLDLAVGAPASGRVYVYRGGPEGPGPEPAWVAESPDGVDVRFGSSVSLAGDVNGDGQGDLLVGAPDYDGEAENEGRVYLFSEFPPPPAAADMGGERPADGGPTADAPDPDLADGAIGDRRRPRGCACVLATAAQRPLEFADGRLAAAGALLTAIWWVRRRRGATQNGAR